MKYLQTITGLYHYASAADEAIAACGTDASLGELRVADARFAANWLAEHNNVDLCLNCKALTRCPSCGELTIPGEDTCRSWPICGGGRK